MKLTVYYNGQYWLGILEELAAGKLKATRYIFGAEPYDVDVLHFVNKKMLSLINEANANIDVKVPVRPANPKRLAREVAKEIRKVGVSTFAQAAIQNDYETRKVERKEISKQRRKEIAMYKREIKVRKAKAKKRGH